MSIRLQLKPILIGLAVPFVVGIPGAVLVPIILAALFDSGTLRPDQVTDVFRLPSGFFLVGAIVNTVSSFLSGYVAGRFASADRTLHGTVVGTLSVAIEWALRSLPSSSRPPMVWAIFSACLTIGFGSFGGYWAARRLQPKGVSEGE